MLTRIIVASYATLVEISLWLFLIFSLVAGWNIGKGAVGAFVGLVVGFVVAVMFFGAFLILDDIRRSIKVIENKKQTLT